MLVETKQYLNRILLSYLEANRVCPSFPSSRVFVLLAPTELAEKDVLLNQVTELQKVCERLVRSQVHCGKAANEKNHDLLSALLVMSSFVGCTVHSYFFMMFFTYWTPFKQAVFQTSHEKRPFHSSRKCNHPHSINVLYIRTRIKCQLTFE